MSSLVGKLHDWKYSKWIDPVGYYSQDLAHKSSSGLVNESSRAMQSIGDKWGWNTKVPEYGKNLSQKDKDSFGRWGENTIGGIGSVFGGMYALGGEAGAAGGAAGGSSAGGAAAGGAAPNALGYGLGGTAGYTLPGSGGAAAGGAAGGGLGGAYMEQGGGMVADAPGGGFSWLNSDGTSGATGALGQGGQGMNWQDMLQQQSGQKQQQQNYAGGRQNLPLYENEKTDQQKLAELLKALQDQQGYA